MHRMSWQSQAKHRHFRDSMNMGEDMRGVQFRDVCIHGSMHE